MSVVLSSIDGEEVKEEKKKEEEEGRVCLNGLDMFLASFRLLHLKEKLIPNGIDMDELELLDWKNKKRFESFCDELEITSQIDRLRFKSALYKFEGRKKQHALIQKERREHYELMQRRIIPVVGDERSAQLQQEFREGKIPKIHMTIVGDSRVGKSSMLDRLCYKIFTENPTRTNSKDLHDVRSIFVQSNCDNGQVVLLHLWDTVGQEQYSPLPSSVLRGKHCIVLMYDVNARKTFEHCNKWIEQIRQINTFNSLSLVLVGNKMDERNDTGVSTEEGWNYANQLRIKFYETSNRTGENVPKLFVDCVTAAYNIVKAQRQTTSVVAVKSVNLAKASPSEEKKCC